MQGDALEREGGMVGTGKSQLALANVIRVREKQFYIDPVCRL